MSASAKVLETLRLQTCTDELHEVIMTIEMRKCKSQESSFFGYSNWSERQLQTRTLILNNIPSIHPYLCDYIAFNYGLLRECIEFANYYDHFMRSVKREEIKQKHALQLIDEKFADWMNQKDKS
ncbi:hypothetical protein APD42_07630 [Acinetobacter nosocomialis]|nr:hypothetical protein APD42_07630 [Acinetobacter nosocomialis]